MNSPDWKAEASVSLAGPKRNTLLCFTNAKTPRSGCMYGAVLRWMSFGSHAGE